MLKNQRVPTDILRAPLRNPFASWDTDDTRQQTITALALKAVLAPITFSPLFSQIPLPDDERRHANHTRDEDMSMKTMHAGPRRKEARFVGGKK